MKTPRILIVEDDPAYQLSLEMLLEKLDFGYRIAESGEQAINVAQHTHFDLALLDIQLAGKMTGIELACELIQQFGTPIIFLTSNDDLSTYEKARNAADAAFLVKPVNELTLRSVIGIALRKHSFALQPDATPKSVAVKDDVALKFIFLKHKGRTERIEIKDIIFAKADGNYCYLQTAQKRFVIKTSLHKINEKLKLPAFQQIHRSFIIRLDCVKNVDLAANKVQVGQEQLPLGISYKDALVQRLHCI